MSISSQLSVVEVATLLGVCEKWVYVNKETVPGYYRLGSLIRFDRETLVDWIKGNCTPKPTKRIDPTGDDEYGLFS